MINARCLPTTAPGQRCGHARRRRQGQGREHPVVLRTGLGSGYPRWGRALSRREADS